MKFSSYLTKTHVDWTDAMVPGSADLSYSTELYTSNNIFYLASTINQSEHFDPTDLTKKLGGYL